MNLQLDRVGVKFPGSWRQRPQKPLQWLGPCSYDALQGLSWLITCSLWGWWLWCCTLHSSQAQPDPQGCSRAGSLGHHHHWHQTGRCHGLLVLLSLLPSHSLARWSPDRAPCCLHCRSYCHQLTIWNSFLVFCWPRRIWITSTNSCQVAPPWQSPLDPELIN